MLSQAPKLPTSKNAGNAYPASILQRHCQLLGVLKLLKWFGCSGSTDIAPAIEAPSVVPDTNHHSGSIAECVACSQQQRRYVGNNCVVCGGVFFPAYLTTRYCSGRCRQKAYRDRKDAQKAAEAPETERHGRTNASTPLAADLSGQKSGTRHTAVNPRIKLKTG
jgi:hypothetical protein